MDIISGIKKLLYWPLCRAYARHLGDRPADPILRWLCIPQFWSVYRFWPDFVHPHRFSEKLWNRMLYDRNPIFPVIMDKLLVRDYVAKNAGNEHLIPLLWSGEDPEDIPFAELPQKFVIKTNHGCGYNILVRDKAQMNSAEIKRQIRRWLSENFGRDKYLGIAWGYKKIKPVIIIETFIEVDQKPPVDYKFYCFSGRAELISLHFDRFEDRKIIALDRDFVRYRFSPGFKQDEIEYQRPHNSEPMVQLAEILSKDFDFMRVDLYSLENKIYFGELTPYPVGVSAFHSLDIACLDETFGKKWGKNS